MKHNHAYLAWFIALLPIMLLRDYTPDNELRYLSIVDEALRNGDIFTFTNQGEMYADKPPLYFWLMMVGKILLGGHRMWYLSLLSFLPAIIVIATMNRWLRQENEETKGNAALMLMTAGLFAGLAIVIRMDMLMTLFITLALYTFFRMYQGVATKKEATLFPLYLFLALFSKGPVGILVPLLSTLLFLLYRRKLRTWHRYWGWRTMVILLLGCGIWFTGVYLESGSEYLNNLLVHQTVGRGINAFHHKRPFYYYLISVWYSLAPWMLLSVGIIVAGMVRRKIQTELEQFFLIIILSTFVMLSVISSKLSVYMLPAFPFFIYLAALQLKKFDANNGWLRLTVAIPAVVLAASLPILIILSKSADTSYLGIPLVYLAATVSSLSSLYLLYSLYWKKQLHASMRIMGFGILLTLFVAGMAIPQLNAYFGWRELCEKAAQLADEKTTTTYYVYKISRAESMDVYLNQDVVFTTKEAIVNHSLKGQLLMLPEKTIRKDSDIRSVIGAKEQYSVGKYIIVVF
jgi:4-amino-4-deoxy-L-arabinose transferase-like glycosyltransferase